MILSIAFCFGEKFTPEETKCHMGQAPYVAIGIVGSLISATLVIGAHKRKTTVILVWMVLAILLCVGQAIMAIILVYKLASEKTEDIVDTIEDTIIKDEISLHSHT